MYQFPCESLKMVINRCKFIKCSICSFKSTYFNKGIVINKFRNLINVNELVENLCLCRFVSVFVLKDAEPRFVKLNGISRFYSGNNQD